jgi:hypothetical protein
MNATNSTTPPVDESGNDLDQLRARIDAKYYTRSKEKPAPMRQEAFHGLAGEVVKIVAPVPKLCWFNYWSVLVTQLVGNPGSTKPTITTPTNTWCWLATPDPDAKERHYAQSADC